MKVKRLSEDAVLPVYAKQGDSGFDLVATEDILIEPGETKLVPTGLAFEIPEGYELQVRPRSGVSAKTKLRVANAPGTVDAGFRGEVKVIIDNIAQRDVGRETNHAKTLAGDMQWAEGLRIPRSTYLIRKGDRIAQGVIAPVARVHFEEVSELSESERGTGGFGSTGTTHEEVTK